MNRRLTNPLTFGLLALSLLFAACAPNTMGGAETSDVAGNVEVVYQGSEGEIFAVVEQTLTQAPGWTVAASNRDTGYVRVEQTTLRARFLAAPLEVTEFLAITLSTNQENITIVSAEYTSAAANLSQSVFNALDAQFSRQ